MATIVRLGIQVPPADPFWVQMREAIVQYAQAMRIEVISFDLEALALENAEQETAALELIQALELDTIISHLLPTSLLRRVLKADIPVIYLNEHALRSTSCEMSAFSAPTGP
jgi:hypothetical protein